LLTTLLLALPAAAQTFQRKPAKETSPPEREVKALPVVEGDPDGVAKDRITIQQLKQKLDNKEEVVILDVRGNPDYRHSLVKLPGAIRIPYEEVAERLKELPKDKEIVTYCACVNESTSGAVAQTLLDHGFKSAKALIGGFDKWEAAGYPVEPKEKKSK
jgi:rhodanese-related sulfurtransferase